MADKAQLEILKQGPNSWNAWRQQHPVTVPDLTEADLSGADLSCADLRSAKLVGTDLTQAKLRSAKVNGGDLSRANLSSADLRAATLNDADLTRANFTAGDLSRADLRSAKLNGATLILTRLTESNLSGADLTAADLAGADLTRANLREVQLTHAGIVATQFVDVDLSTAKGLERVKHRGPSSIGIDTIYRSKGNIPQRFLRGIGVPDPFITNMRSLVAAMEPIEFYSCFISYSTKDQPFADRLYSDLQTKGVRCWFASEDLKIGEKFRQAIDSAIRVHDKLLLALSESSVNSSWVEKEVETAFEKERLQDRTVLFPIRLDNAVMNTNKAWAADIRRTRHIGDFRSWKNHDSYTKSFDRLLRDLKAERGEGS